MRDGACAFADFAGPQVRQHGTDDAPDVGARVFKKAFIFRGQDGVYKQVRNFAAGDKIAAFGEHLAKYHSLFGRYRADGAELD